MALLGARAWWMPRWMEPIVPHLQLEGSTAEAAAEPAPGGTAPSPAVAASEPGPGGTVPSPAAPASEPAPEPAPNGTAPGPAALADGRAPLEPGPDGRSEPDPHEGGGRHRKD
jgi:hypothetical protein